MWDENKSSWTRSVYSLDALSELCSRRWFWGEAPIHEISIICRLILLWWIFYNTPNANDTGYLSYNNVRLWLHNVTWALRRLELASNGIFVSCGGKFELKVLTIPEQDYCRKGEKLSDRIYDANNILPRSQLKTSPSTLLSQHKRKENSKWKNHLLLKSLHRQKWQKH